MAETSIPVRTCVGCRKRAPVTELLRVVVADGVLTPDPRRRLPGRGASVHPTPECLHAAERRRAFGRALRCSPVPDAGPLRLHVLGASAEAVAGAAPGRAGPVIGPTTRHTAPTEPDRHAAGPHVESRTSSDEPAVKSPR